MMLELHYFVLNNHFKCLEVLMVIKIISVFGRHYFRKTSRSYFHFTIIE